MDTDFVIVRARIPSDIKEAAVANLRKMGITTSDLIRLAFFHIAREEGFPFELTAPRSINLDSLSEEEVEKSLSKTLEEEEQGMFQEANEVFVELRKESLKYLQHSVIDRQTYMR